MRISEKIRKQKKRKDKNRKEQNRKKQKRREQKKIEQNRKEEEEKEEEEEVVSSQHSKSFAGFILFELRIILLTLSTTTITSGY